MKQIYLFAFFLAFSYHADSQIISIPDANFKSLLFGYVAEDEQGNIIDIDANNDNEFEVSEVENIYSLMLDGYSSNVFITSLEGIQFFTGLRTLSVNSNLLTNLDVSMLPQLENLYCKDNNLTELNVAGLSQLKRLGALNNEIISLDLSGLSSLEYLNVSHNLFTALDVSELSQLVDFYCQNTLLATLDVSGLTHLTTISCPYNMLTSLNLEGTSNLQGLSCQYNQLTQLDVSDCTLLTYLNCDTNFITAIDLSQQTLPLTIMNASNNQLAFISFKNGIGDIGDGVTFSNNPGLLYACSDYFEEYQLGQKLYNYGNNLAQQTSYCTTEPGGYLYAIEGANKLSLDGDCTSTTYVSPFQKYNAVAGDGAGISYYANALGKYHFPFPAGFASITPVLEMPSYFGVSPANVETIFPEQASPLTQDFCLSPTGEHADVEISIIPTTVARPGFVSHYKIIYRNKGNMTVSGTVSTAYDDTLMDFSAAQPAADNAAEGSLSWNFSNLYPFEVREVAFSMTVSTPQETPPVNAGDSLQFSADAALEPADEFTEDNAAVINQLVLASLDPNDKVCAEGTTVGPEYIGKYVHYVIRFENTGTYAAENIVVKDMIDINKYDVTTLQPLSGSHSFETRVTGNKVEFVFNNIQLPFEDGSNDGYVAFKIKTLPSLVLGDTFENKASIYFDYNFPIVTDPAITTIQELNAPDFEFSKHFTLFPNPAQQTLNIAAKDNIEINSVSIYNALGQAVLDVKGNSFSTIDVSSLGMGSYFVKVLTIQGSATAIFIKN